MRQMPEVTHTFDATGLDTARLLDKVSERAYAVAADWMGYLDNLAYLKNGVRLVAFARKVEKLAAEARRLGI